MAAMTYWGAGWRVALVWLAICFAFVGGIYGGLPLEVVGLPAYALCAILGIAIAENAERVKRRRAMGICVGCGYDLTGNVSGVCPECGRAATPRGAA